VDVDPGIDAVLRRLTTDNVVIAASDGSRHEVFPVAIPPDEGAHLRAWVARERATRTVEVGLGYAIAALFICEGLRQVGDDVAHTAIDPYQATRFANCGIQILHEAGLVGLVDLVEGESQLVLPRFIAEGRSFDLAFVDGNHRFDGVFLDLASLGRLVRPGGIIFLDDYQLPSIRAAASFFITNLGWTIEDSSSDDERHHWVVLRTSIGPDTRAFDHFLPF
jgi:predicted O-methyltransferase YrrM